MTSERRRLLSGQVLALVLLGLLVGYPFSYGPFFALDRRGRLPDWVEFVYSPIDMGIDHAGPSLKPFVTRYCNWWYDGMHFLDIPAAPPIPVPSPAPAVVPFAPTGGPTAAAPASES